MNNNREPVILGTSLTGLLISLSLSREGIYHTLIGGESPGDEPRLGESLNECASPGLWCEFGREFRDCFFTKSHISLLNGDRASMAYIADPTKCVNRANWLHGEPGSRRPSIMKLFRASLDGSSLMHVDRVRFDKKVYAKAIAQPQCRFVRAMIERVVMGHDADCDAVRQIQLDNGTTINDPAYVFDTLGYRSPVVDAANIATHPLSEMQRLVWTHYEADTASGPLPDRLWWRSGTNLLRLEESRDKVDGIAWMIPLGNTLSVGVSVDSDRYGQNALDKEELRMRLDNAFARRGVDYRYFYPVHEKKTMEIVHRYYRRERAFGANWILAGGGYISIWFPSSAGLWTSLAVSRIASGLIADPIRLGRRYQEMMTEPLLRFHDLLEGMARGPSFTDNRAVFRFWSRWLAGIPYRLADFLQLESGQPGWNPFGWLKIFSRTMLRFRLLQLFAYGFTVIHVRTTGQLETQADAFQGYYQRIRFALDNTLRGPLQYLGVLR